MKHKVKITLEYQEEFEIDGAIEDVEGAGEERCDQLEEALYILGGADRDSIKTLCYVDEDSESLNKE